MRRFMYIQCLVFSLLWSCFEFSIQSNIDRRSNDTQPTTVNWTETIECRVDLRLIPSRNLTKPNVGRSYSLVLNAAQQQQVELECFCCCDETFAPDLSGRLRRSRKTVSKKLQYRILSTNDQSAYITTTRKPHDHARADHQFANRTTHSSDCGQNVQKCTEDFISVGICTVYDDGEDVTHTTKGVVRKTAKQSFYIYADSLGHSEVKVKLVLAVYPDKTEDQEISSDATEHKINEHLKPMNWTSVADAQMFVTDEKNIIRYPTSTDEGPNATFGGHWERVLNVTVQLRPQKFYVASDWSAAVIAFLIALSVGCCNDPVMVCAQLKNPRALVIGICCQLLLLPALTFAIIACFSRDEDQAFGLFVTSTVPGGGLAYLFTYLVNGDRQLSAALSFVTSWLVIITSPVWIFIYNKSWYQGPVHVERTIGWLLVVTVAQMIGTILRGCRPGVAHGVLTWFTRPLLLLAGILLVTLGVYINQHAFSEFDAKLRLIFGLLLLITLGFIFGWIAGQFTGKGLDVSKTLATESAVLNGLLCVPLLRSATDKPEGDMAAVSAVWATVLIPICLAYHAVVTVLHRWLQDFLQRRKKSEEPGSIAAIINAGTRSRGATGDIGAASVAAVAAAAIAVAPAITAGPRIASGPMVNLTYVNTNDSEATASPNRSSLLTSSNSPEKENNVKKLSNPLQPEFQEGKLSELVYLPTLKCDSHQPGLNKISAPSTSERQKHHAHHEGHGAKSMNSPPKELVTMKKHSDHVRPHVHAPLEIDPLITNRAVGKHHKRHNNVPIHENSSPIPPPHKLERHHPTPYTNL